MKYAKTVAAATVAFIAMGASAHAGCADPRQMKGSTLHSIPGFIVAGLQPKTSEPDVASPTNAGANIVGTWLVTYTSGGNPAGQALIQWHSDRTEWESINFPVDSGNICVGSWKVVDPMHVTRLHMGWLYTAGLLTGYFTETETALVSSRNAYTGAADIKIFDTAGDVLAEFPVTSSAVRFGP
jgi:hypothetical protein